jgi:hypothetical protein
MTDAELEKLERPELIRLVLALLKRVEKFEALERRVAELEEQLREAKRAKAPFSKGKPKADPKRPGRKPGQGRFERRGEPIATGADEVRELDAALPLDQRECPKCRVLLATHEERASIEELPEQPARKLTFFKVEVGQCRCCGFKARGTHPELPPAQCGAAAHAVGPAAKARALQLHYETGLPLRKVPGVMLALTGIPITQSALTRTALELCGPQGALSPAYDALAQEIRDSAVAFTDDTGWRIGAKLAFVMGFFTGQTAYYQIRLRHRSEEVEEVISREHKGAVVTDGGPSYGSLKFDAVEMQRCLCHILKNISKVLEKKEGAAREFPEALQTALRKALKLWKDHADGGVSKAAYKQLRREIGEEVAQLLRIRKLGDGDNQRLLDGIGTAHDNGRLLLFLERPEVPPTNNHAERMLRPAVIARKVSQCSKNERGAAAYAKLKSLFVTYRLRAIDGAKAVERLISGQPMGTAAQVG